MTTQPSFILKPFQASAIVGMLIALVTLTHSAPVSAQLPPPNLTHVNNVNAAGTHLDEMALAPGLPEIHLRPNVDRQNHRRRVTPGCPTWPPRWLR